MCNSCFRRNTGRVVTQEAKLGAERDAHGNLQLSGTGALEISDSIYQGKINIQRVRSIPCYVQRFAGCVSDVDQHEAREAVKSCIICHLA